MGKVSYDGVGIVVDILDHQFPLIVCSDEIELMVGM
jgi:hypothetical protein